MQRVSLSDCSSFSLPEISPLELLQKTCGKRKQMSAEEKAKYISCAVDLATFPPFVLTVFQELKQAGTLLLAYQHSVVLLMCCKLLYLPPCRVA